MKVGELGEDGAPTYRTQVQTLRAAGVWKCEAS